MNLFNDVNKKVAAWSARIQGAGLVSSAEINTESIADITPSHCDQFAQCHFFSGVAGWPYALRLAGWPEDREVWTGSCPCQPFSVAGKGEGINDPRHLWPAFRWLIAQCRPSVVFGEQVASKDGRLWLDGIRADLEAMGYAFGGADLCAAGCGAPHIRQRLFWGARLADAECLRHNGRETTSGRPTTHEIETGVQASGLAYADGANASTERQQRGGQQRLQPGGSGAGGMGATVSTGPQGFAMPGDNGNQPGRNDTEPSRPVAATMPWNQSVAIECSDGKYRRIPATERGEIEPAFFPLADRIPSRMVRISGYGNAIVPQLAAVFIQAFMKSLTS